MEKEFIPYEEALDLQEIGYDEPYFRYYDNKGKLFYNALILSNYLHAPTFSQAFRWFREKYGLHSYIEGSYPWFRYYINSDDDRWEGFKHSTFEEAELECLKKLIEIIKEKQNAGTI